MSERADSRSEFRERDIDISKYSFNEDEGAFTGTLIAKRLGKKMNIIAYVDLDDGRKIVTSAFAYPNDYLGIDDIPMGSRVLLIFRASSQGKVWLREVWPIYEDE